MSTSTVNQPEQFLRLPAVKALVGWSATSTLYREMAAGRFPSPVRIGARSVAWKASEIAAWQSSRPPARVTAGRSVQQSSPTQ